MTKNFDTWNTLKKQTHDEESRLYTVREIWWCRLGVNVGSEQDGSGHSFFRPVVIIRAFGPETCAVIPLTTSPRPHRLRIGVGMVQDKEAKALLSQLRVIDTRRLVEKVCFLDKEIFTELRKAVRNLF